MADSERPLSAASKRALAYTRGPEWFCEFREHNLMGEFAYEKGVIRRDPSAVLRIDDTYHTWYTRGEGETAGFHSGDPEAKVFPWDLTEVWQATSKDGWTWKEEGLAVGRGPAGAYDDRAVFTPEVFAHQGTYYLVYQTLPKRSVGGALRRSRQELCWDGHRRLPGGSMAEAAGAGPVCRRQRRVAWRCGRSLQRRHPG